MRIRRRTLRRLLPLSLLLLLFAAPALSQNLLSNPSFRQGLSGWTVLRDVPVLKLPGYANGTVSPSLDGSAGVGSYSAAIGASANAGRVVVGVSQCVPVRGDLVYAFGARVRVDSREGLFGGSIDGLFVGVVFDPTPSCRGFIQPSPGVSESSLPGPPPTRGLWSPLTGQVTAPSWARGATVYSAAFVGAGSFGGAVDDMFLTPSLSFSSLWVLPSAAHSPGLGSSLWTTDVVLANPGSVDTFATLKFLGHDADGRSGDEKTFLVRAGTLVEYADVLGSLFGVAQGYGAILVTSSSASLVVQSETSTPSSGGTVGQAVPAFGPDDFAAATPKTLAPIREDADFRTNIVLTNTTEIPVSALLELLDEGGNHLENQEVRLPPLGMTQIRGVALGYAARYMRSLRVSTRTPGGLVAAYASVIDNTSNDPRAVLPRDLAAGPMNSNLLSNPGFDHDLAGWDISSGIAGSASWAAVDVSGNSSSGSLELDSQEIDSVNASQCVPVEGSRLATAGTRTRTDAQVGIAGSAVTVSLFDQPGCVGTSTVSAEAYELPYASPVPIDSGGVWRRLAVQIFTLRARSASVQVSANSHYSAGPPSRSHVFADDVFMTLAAAATPSVLPSAARSHAGSGAFWRTRLTLTNPLSTYAFVTLTFIGHDDSGTSPLPEYAVPAGGSITVSPDAFPETWGAIRVASSAPVLLQSETSTETPVGGTVGQALPAFGASLFAGAAPKTLLPVRENAAFRTNLVLANATEILVTAHVVLYAADGAVLGARDVDLPPLGMTQINRVASALGAASLDAGRLSISTPTPGGLIAAYASVIDNVTNDPRTLLPR